MLSVWWGVRRINHWEVLPNGCNITADLHCQQLNRLAAKLQEKQERVYFLHDNTRPHLAKPTREKLLKLEWITISHPSYSPDLTPTDYHLYRSLSNYFHEKQFDNENNLKMELVKFFGQKSRVLYERGILSLPRALATSRRQQWSIFG